MLGKCTEFKTTEGVFKPIHLLTFEVNEPSILLATISCHNWLFVCVQVLQFRSLFVEERTASNFHFEGHFEDLFLAQAQLCKTSHFTSLCSSQSAVFALCHETGLLRGVSLIEPMNNPLGVSPSKGNQGTTRRKEKIFWPRWESNPRPPD